MMRKDCGRFPRPLCLLLYSVLAILQLKDGNAQHHLCSCSPLVYKWTIDFTRTCASSSLLSGTYSGKGVASVECDINMVDDEDPIDLVPVTVNSFEIIEFDSNRLAPVKIESEGDLYLEDGRRLALTSETAVDSSLVTGGIKATTSAVNAAGHAIKLTWFIRYSNLCGVKPFEIGDSIGWMVFNDDAVPARDQSCILPTKSPTRNPTVTPTGGPSAVPSQSSSQLPTFNPTRKPTNNPTIRPSPHPTRNRYGKGKGGKGKETKAGKHRRTRRRS